MSHPGAVRRICRVGTALLLLAACGEGPTAPSGPVDLAAPWQTASPRSQSVDPVALARALDHAAGLPRLSSLLVVRHGRLVLEQYFNGKHREDLADVRSVTKSVVSTLVGIAIGRGELAGLDVTIGDYLDPAHRAGLDPAKQAITVGQLLTMSAGFQWDESIVAGYNDWVLSPDPIQYLLNRPLAATPGSRFAYNSATVDLLGFLLERAVGASLQEYARDHLFGPLGIAEADWETFANGRANGGAGLDLRPRDLARLGALWLDHGFTGTTRIVPAEWITEATAPHYPYWRGAAPLDRQSYGLLWWIDQSGSRTDFFAWGYGGQFIWVSPSLDLVIVVTTIWQGDPDAATRAANGLDLIVNWVIPAVH